MARITIDLPEKVAFSTEIIVRVSDINYGGHVGNDSILTLMQEARVNYYRSMGIKDEVNIGGNVGQIITDACVVYKAEAFLGDVLRVDIYLGEFNKYGFDMYYRLVNSATGKEVARGKTGILCFDYSLRKVATIPSSFFAKLNETHHDNQ